jgi:ketosteroid isomerase-like protein
MSDNDQLLAAERQRAAAVVALDLESLATCLDENLIYVHATGTVHDRGELLEYIRTGPRFHEVRLEPRSTRIHGNVGMVFGDLRLRLQRAGEQPVEAHSVATELWVRHGSRWQLVSFQSTRIP